MDLLAGVILFTLTTGGHVHHIDFDTPAQCEAAKAVIAKNNVEANVCKTFGSGSLACIVQIDCIPLPAPVFNEEAGEAMSAPLAKD